MADVKHIFIKEPIWKGRKVGLDVHDVNDDTIVEVQIDYKNKDGNLAYPQVFQILASKVKTYTADVKLARRGIDVRLVPINDLTVIDQNKMAKKKDVAPETAAQISQAAIDKIIAEVPTGGSGGGKSSGKKVPAGENLLTQKSVEMITAKTDPNQWAIMIKWTKGDDFRDIVNFYWVGGKYPDREMQFLVRYLYKTFGYTLQAFTTPPELINQIEPFNGTVVKACVKHMMKYFVGDDNKPRMISKPVFGYSGPVDEDLYIDVAKLIIPANTKDQEQYDAAVKAFGASDQDEMPKSPAQEKAEEDPLGGDLPF